MSGSLRLVALVAINNRGPLAPLLALLLALLGVFAYRPNDVAGTWALTALLCLPLTAWLQVAIARTEPAAQRLIRIAASGATRARRAEVAATAILAAATTLTFLLWPLIIGAFDRPVTATDLVAAVMAHAACAATGGALGRLVGPPVSGRAATALTVILIATIGTVALSQHLGPLAGPGAVADALADTPPGTLPAALLAAITGTLAWAATAAWLARRLEDRAG